MSSCDTRRPVFMRPQKICLLVSQEDMSSCVTRSMSSCGTRRQDMSSCATRRHVFLCHKKTYFLVSQEDMSSCATTKPPIQKTHHFYTISHRPFPELFGDPFFTKRTICIPCVLGPTEFIFYHFRDLGL